MSGKTKDDVVKEYSGNLKKTRGLFSKLTLDASQKEDMRLLEEWLEETNEKILKNADAFNKLSDNEKSLFNLLNILEKTRDSSKRLSDLIDEIAGKNKTLAEEVRNLSVKLDENAENVSDVDAVLRVISKTHDDTRETWIKFGREVAKSRGQLEYFEKELLKLETAAKDSKVDVLTGKIDSIGNIVKQVGQSVKNFGMVILEPWSKAHQAAADYSRAVGMSGQAMDKFRKDTIDFVNNSKISANYNTSIEELIKLQSQYSSLTQRNIRLSESQKETMVATARVMGNDKALDFTAKLENFGIGMEKSGKIASEMFNTAAKHGVNFENYTKVVSDNLTLVQNYGFRNGVQGLTSMARKATELKLNMQQAASFAEKVNTVEGAITTSANLQVLGGPFANYSDPMGMLYEGLNDLEGLQDRMIKMMSGLGKFNAATGEVELSNFNKVRVREASRAMGVSAQEMTKMINQAGVRNEIERQVSSDVRRDKELLNLIKNVASFNSEGRAVVDLGDGRGEVNVSDVKKTDIEKLRQLNQTEGEDIKDIAKTLRGWDDIMQGTKKQLDATKAQVTERLGIGKTVLNIAEKIGQSNFLLHSILIAQLAMSAFTGFKDVNAARRGVRDAWRKEPIGGTGGGRFTGGGAASSLGQTQGVPKFLENRILAKNGIHIDSAGRPVVQTTNGNIRQSSQGWFSEVGKKGRISNSSGGVQEATKKLANATKSLSRSAKLLKAGGGAVAAGAISGLIHGISGDFKSGPTVEDRTRKNKAIGGTIGATIGGALGFLGPVAGVLGSMVGEAVGGAIGGAISKAQTEKRNKTKIEIVERFNKGGQVGRTTAKAFASLQGDYSKRQLRMLEKAMADGKIDASDKISDKLLKKLNEAGDITAFKGLEETFAKSKFGEKMNVANQTNTVQNATFNIKNPSDSEVIKRATGGLITGPSHSEGGLPILGTPIEVEGGEYVVNKEATRENFHILERINNNRNFSKGISEKESTKVNSYVSEKINNNHNNNKATTERANFEKDFTQKNIIKIFDTRNHNKPISKKYDPEKIFVERDNVNSFKNDKVKPSNSRKSNETVSKKVNTERLFAQKDIIKPLEITKNVGPTSILISPTVEIKPSENNSKSGIQPLKVTPTSVETTNSTTTEVGVKPIKLDVSGTIKLAGGGKEVDITKIIETPEFLTQLAQLIENRLQDNIQGGNYKESRKNKLHTYLG